MGGVEIVSQGFACDPMDYIRFDELFRRLSAAFRSMLGGRDWYDLTEQGVVVQFRTGGPLLIEDTIDCFAPSGEVVSVADTAGNAR